MSNYYATVKMDDGSTTHLVLHIFGSASERDEWVASEPKEPGHGEMWEKGEREAIRADDARGTGYFSGVDLHGVRESSLPMWAYDAVNSPRMSLQAGSEKGVESYWTTVSYW